MNNWDTAKTVISNKYSFTGTDFPSGTKKYISSENGKSRLLRGRVRSIQNAGKKHSVLPQFSDLLNPIFWT